MTDKQIQRGGDGSQQIQAGQIIINQGITEERARQIVDEKIQEVIQEYSLEAHEEAEKRIQAFSNELVPRLVRENLLDSLKDPGVQMTLKEAEKTAVGSERENDHELLSELLIHRVKKGSDYMIKAGVNQAVKIVDEISDEALLGLTVAHAIGGFIPTAGEIRIGLKAMDELFSKIIAERLPTGTGWLDHLDILNAVRVDGSSGLKKLDVFYSEVMSGYVDVGIQIDSEAHQKAVKILGAVGLPKDILINHELREGYIRLNVVRRDKLDLLKLIGEMDLNFNGAIVKLPVDMQLSQEQNKALSDIYDMYENDQTKRNENIIKFTHILDEYDTLKVVKRWWDNINTGFTITSVGKALAQANAKKCDPNLPDLN